MGREVKESRERKVKRELSMGRLMRKNTTAQHIVTVNNNMNKKTS